MKESQRVDDESREKRIRKCLNCGKVVNFESLQCESCKLQNYLTGILEKKALQAITSYSLVNLNECDLKKYADLQKNHNQNSNITKEVQSKPDEKVFVSNKYFRKYRGTFTKLQRKFQNLEKYYPEIYYKDESVIDMWSSFELQRKLDLGKLEFDDDNMLWY